MTPALRVRRLVRSTAEEIHTAALEQDVIDLKGYAALLLERRPDHRQQGRRGGKHGRVRR